MLPGPTSAGGSVQTQIAVSRATSHGARGHTHTQQRPLLLRVWGNFQRVDELERASLGAATWGSLTPGFGGKQDSHTRASTAHSMTEMPTWGQRLHSYSALHRAPDSHIRHSLLLPVLHLPHSLSCQLYEKRYEMTTIKCETSTPTSLRSLRLDQLQAGCCAWPATRT